MAPFNLTLATATLICTDAYRYASPAVGNFLKLLVF
jgi:hypothetical protein